MTSNLKVITNLLSISRQTGLALSKPPRSAAHRTSAVIYETSNIFLDAWNQINIGVKALKESCTDNKKRIFHKFMNNSKFKYRHIYCVIAILVICSTLRTQFYIFINILDSNYEVTLENIILNMILTFGLVLGLALNLQHLFRKDPSFFLKSLRYNKIFYSLQIFQFKIFGIFFYCMCSPEISMNFLSDNKNWQIGYVINVFSFSFSIKYNNETDIFFSLNLFTSIILIVLIFLFKTIKVNTNSTKIEGN